MIPGEYIYDKNAYSRKRYACRRICPIQDQDDGWSMTDDHHASVVNESGNDGSGYTTYGKCVLTGYHDRNIKVNTWKHHSISMGRMVQAASLLCRYQGYE